MVDTLGNLEGRSGLPGQNSGTFKKVPIQYSGLGYNIVHPVHDGCFKSRKIVKENDIMIHLLLYMYL